MILFLTSALDTYYKDENGNKIPQAFPNDNGVVDNLKKYIKKYDNFLFVASNETGYEKTDMYFDTVGKSFALTLPFKHYQLLDGRTKGQAKQLVEEADFIFLCGGHVPTQNQFFQNINLREIIKNTNAVVLGGSAGSMNCAEIIYCPPELEGEGVDKSFKRYFKGLGLTKINIFPHFEDIRYETIDGLENEKDILIPDSYHSPIIAYSDGAYILQVDGKATMFGEAYLFENGKRRQICENNKSVELDDLINNEKI